MVDQPTSSYSGKVFRVLVFPGGTEVGLEINAALRDCKDVELYSVGLAISNHAPFVFARHFEIPSIQEFGWMDALNDVIEREKIDYIFPAFDDVIVALAENADRVKAKIVTSPLDTCLVTRSKAHTYLALRDELPVPRVYDASTSVECFPVFVKPDKGQGSQKAQLINDPEHLAVALRQDPTALILEYLPGKEYTVDCFSDRDKGLLFCSGRERTRTRNGISVSSHGVVAPEFSEFALAISKRFAFYGAWFFQLREDAEGHLKLLEIGPRIAGAMALNRVLGVNFPLLSLYEQERLPVRIMTNPVQVSLDRALVNRYEHNLDFSTVYVDLDDTLVFREKVNSKLVSFLYQCINKEIKLVLLTRHSAQIEQTLRKRRLSGIFDEIISVPPKPSSKSEYIRQKDAILIDDSFSERYAAMSELGISTFDCSMLEMLMDDRV